MQVMEFEKKGFFSTKYGLGLSVPLSADNTIESEFRHIKEAMLEWYGNRGKHAALVHFTILASPDIHRHIEDFIKQVYMHETELGPILRSMEVQVGLFDEKGKEKKKYKLRA